MLNKLLSKQNRALLSELVRTDFKLRYQGSAIGYAWSLLRPLFMFVILYVVFAIVFKVGKDVPNFPIYLTSRNSFMELLFGNDTTKLRELLSVGET
jgi:ABC-2 type transport system permease protein